MRRVIISSPGVIEPNVFENAEFHVFSVGVLAVDEYDQKTGVFNRYAFAPGYWSVASEEVEDDEPASDTIQTPAP